MNFISERFSSLATVARSFYAYSNVSEFYSKRNSLTNKSPLQSRKHYVTSKTDEDYRKFLIINVLLRNNFKTKTEN
jgi:hypothetical protein